MAERSEDRGGTSRRAERRLLRSAQGGSPEGIEQLFRIHWPRAYRAAYVVTRDAAGAEDVAQEAFLAAIRSLHRFDRRRPFGPWLHRIVVNRAIDWTRARQLRSEVGADPAELERNPGPAADGERPIGPELVAAIAELPIEQRAVVAMRYVLELTPGEIARALELPRGTVNSRLRRALDRLAGELEAER